MNTNRQLLMERLRKACTVLAAWLIFFVLSGGTLLGTQPVQAATVCTVRFRETDGRASKKLMELTVKVNKGKKLTLPALPDKTGYISLGWAKKKNSTEVQYKPAEKVKITRNTVFYTVRIKGCTIRFNNNNGTNTGATYSRMTRLVYKDSTFTLPEVPTVAGYENLGWTTKKGKTSPVYAAGTLIKVSKNMNFYAVRKKNASVTLTFADSRGGSDDAYAALAVTAPMGKSVTLPSVPNPEGYTFLGWAGTQGSTRAQYLAGQSVTLNTNMKLYAVMFPRSSEEDPASLENGWQMLYKQIIFVGDSRFNRMQAVLNGQFGSNSAVLMNVSFICKEGQGLSWLENEGIDALYDKISGNQIPQVEKPTAVIFNLGVNDACLTSPKSTAAKYTAYMSRISAKLLAKNCKLFYMSVNPINSSMLAPAGLSARTEARVLVFNQGIQTGLCGEDSPYTYLDTFRWMIENGYSHDTTKYWVNVGRDDGLHYTTQTYKRIFNQCALMLVEKAR